MLALARVGLQAHAGAPLYWEPAARELLLGIQLPIWTEVNKRYHVTAMRAAQRYNFTAVLYFEYGSYPRY